MNKKSYANLPLTKNYDLLLLQCEKLLFSITKTYQLNSLITLSTGK